MKVVQMVISLSKRLSSNLVIHDKLTLKTKLEQYDKVLKQLPYVEGTGTSISLANTIEAPMIELGVGGNSEQDGTPTPSSKVDISNVVGNVGVVVGNKNVVSLSNIINGAFTNASEFEQENYVQTTNTKYRVVRIENLPAGTYTFKINWKYTANIIRNYIDSVVNVVGQESNIYTFTTTKDGLFGLCFRTTTSVDFTDNEYTLQIEKGSTATSYVPHAQQTLPFTLTEGQKMYLSGYLADDGVHHVRGETVLTGQETGWYIQNDCFIIGIQGIKRESSSTNILAISNYYKGVKTNYRDAISSSNNRIGKMIGDNNEVCISDNRFDNTTNFKGWLSEKYNNNTPVKVEYVLATEVVEPYTTTQQRQWEQIKRAISYYGTTNITTTVETGSQPILTAKAILDQNTLVTRINQLELEV